MVVIIDTEECNLQRKYHLLFPRTSEKSITIHLTLLTLTKSVLRIFPLTNPTSSVKILRINFIAFATLCGVGITLNGTGNVLPLSI